MIPLQFHYSITTLYTCNNAENISLRTTSKGEKENHQRSKRERTEQNHGSDIVFVRGQTTCPSQSEKKEDKSEVMKNLDKNY